MDLDFKSVKALASPTRLEILNSVLDEEATTTKLSEDLDKSKSTVSSHLKVLTESGLLEKDEEEGRRRVVYRPTEKAEAIIEGRERKVKFSVVSSALTAAGGILLLSESMKKAAERSFEAYTTVQPRTGEMNAMDQGAQASGGAGGGQMGIISTETANTTVEKAANATMDAANATAASPAQKFQPEQALLVLGIGLLTTSLLAVGYAYILNKLRG
ncbi:MAG: ArsR/SmtB family transcription factor [Candidatus Nanosalina sp.]